MAKGTSPYRGKGADGPEVDKVNFSYRGDHDRDRNEVRALSMASGFEIITAGATPFSLWNGLAVHLRKVG